MKIIDLLVKMANGEAPKRIKYDDIEYFLYDDYTYMKKDKSRLMCSVFFKRLNDEVEVIEDKKIERISCHFSLNYVKSNLTNEEKSGIDNAINNIYCKINEIIDKINEE